MGVSPNDGDNFGLQDYVQSTLEQKTNQAERDRIRALKAEGKTKQEYPKALYKPVAGQPPMCLVVPDEAAHAEKKKVGWVEAHQLTHSELPGDPTKVSGMTLNQATEFIAKAEPGDLGAILADEQSHGNRAKVLKLIEAAMDAVPFVAPEEPDADDAPADAVDDAPKKRGPKKK